MRRASLAHLTGALLSFSASLVAWENTAAAVPPGGQASYDSSSVSYEPPPTVRRGGFAMAVSTGFGAGVYRGYELSVDALNDPNGQKSTGTSMASFSSIWFGGSPRDWLTLGLGVVSMSVQSPEIIGGGAALVAHVEGYPLFNLGGIYQDLGLGMSGGLGVVNMVDAEERDYENPVATSGSLSTLSFEAFWEPWRVWHFSFGPALNYTHAFSQTMNVNQVTLTFRASLYGVQPKKKSEVK